MIYVNIFVKFGVRRCVVKTHREMIDEWMKDPKFVAEYAALE